MKIRLKKVGVKVYKKDSGILRLCIADGGSPHVVPLDLIWSLG